MPLYNSPHLSPKALNYTSNGSGKIESSFTFHLKYLLVFEIYLLIYSLKIGRDTYIGFNCGGLLDSPSKPASFCVGKYITGIDKQYLNLFYSIGSFRTKTEGRTVNSFLPPKHVHYYSDGSGRDKYIM